MTNTTVITITTRMWANAQRHGRPAEYRRCPVPNAAKLGWRPLLDCRAVTLPIGESKTWMTQSELCTWQNSVTEQQRQKCIISIRPGKGQTLCKVWLASVERRRCSNAAKTRNPLEFAEVPQTNEKISATSGPKFTILWGLVEEILLLNMFFSDYRYMPQLRRYSPRKLWDGAQMATFWRLFASCICSEPRAAHFRPAF